MSAQPEEWRHTSLRAVVNKIVDGSHNPPSKQESGFPMLSARNVENGNIVFSDFRYIGETAFQQENDRTRIAADDVLLTIVGTIGRAAVVPKAFTPFTLQRSVAVLSPKPGLLPKFLCFQLQTPVVQRYFEENARGTAQRGVYLKTLGATPLVVPSVTAQANIVAEIEKQFSRLDKAAANLRRVKANIKRYTDGMYEELFAGVPNATLGDVLEKGPQNGLYLPKEMYGEGVPILRIDDYQTGWVRPVGNLKRVRATSGQTSSWALREDDLVINRVNSVTHLGKCLRISKALSGALFESNMMRIRLTPAALPKYVEHYLASRIGKARLTENAKWAVNQASINQKDVCATPLCLPDLVSQQRVITELDRCLSIVRELEAEVDANLKRAQALRQAILAKAFSGVHA